MIRSDRVRLSFSAKSLAKLLVVLLIGGLLAIGSQVANSQPPLVSRTYVVSPTTIALEIVPPPVSYAQQTDYQPSARDRAKMERNNTWVMRGATAVGTLIGREQDILYPLERWEEPALDLDWLVNPNSFQLTPTDGGSSGALRPVNVYRKTKPVDMVVVGKNQRLHPQQHTLYLEFPRELEAERTYTVSFLQGEQERYSSVEVDYLPMQSPSEAVHVSQIGFRPDDPVKVGFLSTWLGTGGGLSYPEGLAFSLIDASTNENVFSGATTLRHRRNTSPTNQPRTLTNVYQMDFSSVRRPGDYRLCVETVGCSVDFPIGSDVWLDAFYVSARGFYHQRSGIALGAPYTDFERPRPFHPDDGLQVFQSTTPLMNTRNGLNAQGTDPDNFTNLIQGKTDEVVPNAWGGYFDAGDWDRRIQHLDVARGMLELLELFPETYVSLSLDLPESQNGVADLLDDALWGLDVFKRMQTEEGGIRGGIESEAHPRFGENSWQESQTVMAYAPGAWSSYIYAGVTARAARVMQVYSPSRADGYRQSALRAMAYAENAYQAGLDVLDAPRAAIDAERALAALELYQLTADPDWHSLFLDASKRVEDNPNKDYRVGNAQRNMAFLYARLPSDRVDVAVQQRLRNQIVRQADRAANYGSQTDYGWTKLAPGVPVGWGGGLGSPKAIPLLRAYALTGDSKYLNAAILACQFSAGANPANTIFTTGLGSRSPQHPLIVDQRISGTTPPPGITIYGPIDSGAYGDHWMFQEFKDMTTPPARQWPAVETYFDIYRIPAINEFTVMQSMLDAMYSWGYLAARG